MKRSIVLLALSCSLHAPASASQTWVLDQAYPAEHEALVEVSPGGQVAVIRHLDGYPAFSFLDDQGTLVREYGRPDAGLQERLLLDALFLDENRLAVCGTHVLDQTAYVGVIDVQTGLTVWERALSGSRKAWSLGQDAAGNLLVGGSGPKGFLCSFTPVGTLSWIRDYEPNGEASLPFGVAVTEGGDLLVPMRDANGDLIVTRTDADTGAEVWTRVYRVSGEGVQEGLAALAPDGDLLVALVLDDGLTTRFGALRIDGHGGVEWARSYSPALLLGSAASFRSVVPTPDGGLLLSARVVDFPLSSLSPAVMRVRPDGSVAWLRQYGDPQDSETAPYLAATSDGGFVGVSTRTSLAGGRLFRASAGGDVGTCAGTFSAVTTGALTVQETPISYVFEPSSGALAPAPQTFAIPDATALAQVCGLTCAPASTYCLAKPNSEGCLPAIGSTGAASAGGPGITVTATEVVNNKQGLLFWGHQASGASFQGGLKCVASPTRRTPAQGSGGSATGSDCTGQYAFTFDAAYLATKGIEIGDTIYCQYWYRDPSAPFTTGLTDAFQFTVCP